MNYTFIACVLPAVFWSGIFLIAFKPKQTLKERTLYYIGKLNIKNNDSPLKASIDKFNAARKKEKMLLELTQSLAYIENIVVLGMGKNISAYKLLEELAEFCPSLSSVYVNMAKDIALHDRESASKYLYRSIGESYAKDIGIFLAGWEDIPQAELIGSIRTYKDILRDARSTKLRKRDELISDIVYFPVVVNCMTVLLNFVYIAYFIDQKDALMMLF